MGLNRKIQELVTRYGKPAKTGVQAVASVLFPGSSNLIEIIGYLFDVSQGTASDNMAADGVVRAAENQKLLNEIELILDEVSNSQHGILEYLSGFQSDLANQIIAFQKFEKNNSELLGRLKSEFDRNFWDVQIRLIRMEENQSTMMGRLELSVNTTLENRILNISRLLEGILRERYPQLTGPDGISDLTISKLPEVNNDFHSSVVSTIIDFLQIRHCIIHDDQNIPPPEVINKVLNDLNLHFDFDEFSAKSKKSIPPTRKQFVVDKNGLGDFESISSAVTEANHGDSIYVLPGFYKETIRIDKAVKILGPVETEEKVIIAASADVVEIYVSNVLIENIEIRAIDEDNFGMIIYPNVDNFNMKNSTISSKNNAGIVCLTNGLISATYSLFLSCKIGIRNEGSAVLDHCLFEDCTTGLWGRKSSRTSIKNCKFTNSDAACYLDGTAKLDIQETKFIGHGFALVSDESSSISHSSIDLTECSNPQSVSSLGLGNIIQL